MTVAVFPNNYLDGGGSQSHHNINDLIIASVSVCPPASAVSTHTLPPLYH